MAIPLDANGLPLGHRDALDLAARELAEVINELPESVYHLSPDDAEWAASRVIHRYLFALRHARALSLVER